MPLRTVTLLGATGSVGRSVRDVVAENPQRLAIGTVVGGRDAEGLARVAIETGARFAALADETATAALKQALAGTGIASGAGRSAVLEAVGRPADIVVSAISGAAGLEATFAALMPGRTIALANKESLVCAGEAVMARAAAVGARMLPLDSEHNALFQVLGQEPLDSIRSMTLTASGGPFRTWSAEQIAEAGPEQALKHPNYAMGAKITVDSAGLMNKGLEVIEARFLFDLRPEQLDVLVHPQQVVHGLVTFRDGSVSAGMAVPDMRVAAAHCLGIDGRLDAPPTRFLDLDRARPVANATRRSFSRWMLMVAEAGHAAFAGRFEEAERMTDEALALNRLHSDDCLHEYTVGRLALAKLRWRPQEVDAAELRGFAARYPHLPAWEAMLASLEWELGHVDAARRAVALLARDDFGTIVRSPDRLAAAVCLAEAAAGTGEPAQVTALYTLLEPYAGANPVLEHLWAIWGPAARALGLLAAADDRPRDASAHFAHAVELASAWGAPGWELRAIGDWLATGVPVPDRAELVARGLALARELGLPHVAARVADASQTITP